MHIPDLPWYQVAQISHDRVSPYRQSGNSMSLDLVGVRQHDLFSVCCRLLYEDAIWGDESTP